MNTWLIWTGISGMLFLSVAHSVAGEKLLLIPMFRKRGNHILESGLARTVLRFAWHVTSIAWALLAMLVYYVALGADGFQGPAFRLIGAAFFLSGVYAGIASRGRFLPWVVFIVTGVAMWFASGVGV